MLYVTLRQLEYVVAVARAGSLSAAAALLHVSQPSLSVAVAQVEARLGRALFLRRKGARLALTPFGTTYLSAAEALIAQAARLEDPARLAQMVEGRLRLGCFEDLAPRYLAPMLNHLRAAMPRVEVLWEVASFEVLARSMLDGRMELALTYDLGLDAGFEREGVAWAVPHAFVAADHELSRVPEVGLVRLADEPLILFDEGLSIRHVLGLFRAAGVRPRVAHRVRSLEVMRSLAAHSEGVGVSYTVPPTQSTYDGRTVVAIPVADEAAREPLILTWPTALAATEAAVAARGHLTDLLRTTPA